MASRTKWEERDLPVLQAIVDIIEETDNDHVEPQAIIARTGFDELKVQRALAALNGAQPPFLRKAFSQGSGDIWLIDGVTERARREVGVWPPSPENLGDRLIDAFNRAADEAESDEQKSRLRRVADSIGALGRDVVTRVAVEVLTRQITS